MAATLKQDMGHGPKHWERRRSQIVPTFPPHPHKTPSAITGAVARILLFGSDIASHAAVNHLLGKAPVSPKAAHPSNGGEGGRARMFRARLSCYIIDHATAPFFPRDRSPMVSRSFLLRRKPSKKKTIVTVGPANQRSAAISLKNLRAHPRRRVKIFARAATGRKRRSVKIDTFLAKWRFPPPTPPLPFTSQRKPPAAAATASKQLQ
ncbi:unnamed protein product [Ectocarpus fasciculatus]